MQHLPTMMGFVRKPYRTTFPHPRARAEAQAVSSELLDGDPPPPADRFSEPSPAQASSASPANPEGAPCLGVQCERFQPVAEPSDGEPVSLTHLEREQLCM